MHNIALNYITNFKIVQLKFAFFLSNNLILSITNVNLKKKKHILSPTSGQFYHCGNC